ncbi:MAG: cobalamin-dependent protein [bacterium]|nr:cobalamin-dependent protein [bacterium]
MKILLVQAHTGRKDFGLVYPIGLAYLAAALTTPPNQYEVKIYDPNLESDPYGTLSEIILSFHPDIVGISQRNIDTTNLRDLYVHWKTLQPTVQLIRRLIPEAITVVGGSGFSLFAEQIMRQVPEVDFGVFREAEESFPELLANLSDPEKVPGIFYRKDGKVLFSGPRGLPQFDALPIPRHDLTQIERYFDRLPAIGVQSKRGCPLKCIYCSYPHLTGMGVRLRSPQSIVDEIELLINQYHVPTYTFVDDIFNVPKEHAEAICQELISRKLHSVPWSAFFDMKDMDESFIRLALKAGCNHFFFSPDAITDTGLNVLQKNFTAQDIRRTAKLCHQIPGVHCGYSFFLNYPGITIGEYLQTLWFFLKENLLLGLRRKGGVHVSWIRIEPHTRLHQIAIEEKIISPTADLLPKTESELKSLFYISPNYKLLNFLTNRMLDMIDLTIGKLIGRKV